MNMWECVALVYTNNELLKRNKKKPKTTHLLLHQKNT